MKERNPADYHWATVLGFFFHYLKRRKKKHVPNIYYTAGHCTGGVGGGRGKKFKLLFSKNVTLNQILRWILKKGNEV